MAFNVDVQIDREFDAACSADQAFELLADVPRSLDHFPKVDQLVDMGDGKYRTEMQKIGIDKYNIQTIYACKYVADADKKTVKWTPVKGVGNGQVSGKWTMKDTPTGCHIKFHTAGEMEVPLPGLIKMLIAPIVRTEFNGLVDQYISNLKKTLDGLGKKKTAAAKKAPAKNPAKKKPAK